MQVCDSMHPCAHPSIARKMLPGLGEAMESEPEKMVTTSSSLPFMYMWKWEKHCEGERDGVEREELGGVLCGVHAWPMQIECACLEVAQPEAVLVELVQWLGCGAHPASCFSPL
jgi:hypothetical protein